MKRNFTLLAALAALIAFAVPASAAATIGVYPAGHKFEIASTTGMPEISGSLAGTCTLTKITGQVPAAPNNVGTSVNLPLGVPTATCGAGISVSFGAGEWLIAANNRYFAGLIVPANGVTLRYSSLPGCKLVNTAWAGIVGSWSNGITTPTLSRAGYYTDGSFAATWANDGGTCAMAGTKETIAFEVKQNPIPATVTDTTNPANVIQMTSGV